MGLIQIENMEFYAYHGHFREERIVGNKFLIDLTLETDMEKPAQSDDIHDAVDYQRAYQIIQKQMDIKSHLLENIGKRILDALYEKFSDISRAEVKVSKMNPPIGGKVEKVSVRMSRPE